MELARNTVATVAKRAAEQHLPGFKSCFVRAAQPKKLLILSVPSFPRIELGDRNGACPVGLL